MPVPPSVTGDWQRNLALLAWQLMVDRGFLPACDRACLDCVCLLQVSSTLIEQSIHTHSHTTHTTHTHTTHTGLVGYRVQPGKQVA